ncbi:GNAT family N-acetyltransferase [Amycolatopsis minnesotensis]|uniref:GNAT family N-acetyltransferase n=1 Tax=Amycolatopsis minnesotensis TaxID=337894 RepID=A0ABN2QA38_9PSEU
MDITRARTAAVTDLGGWQPAEVDSAVWRLRVSMDDGTGTLARIAIRLADLGCNILGVSVLPIPGGVLDEIVVRPQPGLTKQDLAEAIQAEGCVCGGITDAEVRELVDTATATLGAATAAIAERDRVHDAVRDVLTADLVTTVPAAEANPGRTEGGHRVVFDLDGATALVARRRWTPFVQLELTRASALIALIGAARANPGAPAAVVCDDGAAVVLREGVPGDADAVVALHTRCSKTTLFQRYHSGTPTVPRRWLHRLLTPARGLSVLAVCGREVVALGQLLGPPNRPSAEVSLLVEDSWQRNGLGTALLARLAELAVLRGHGELKAVCLPGEEGVPRTAARAGLAAARAEGDRNLVEIALPARLPVPGA